MARELSGYLDVKVPARVRKRGFTPWKTWRRQWCTVRPSKDSVSGVEVQVGTSILNCLQIPADATLCRSESRSRQFAFGVFHHVGQSRRAFLFLAGSSESDSQKWMAHIRKLLEKPGPSGSRGSLGDADFYVSMIDNSHSQAAGLTGFYGVMNVGLHRVTLFDPFQEEVKKVLDWKQLHQFHLAVAGRKEDENKICVIHTSNEFCAGQGQLHVFCLQAPRLLECLLNKGKTERFLDSPLLLRSGRRLSRSESDLHYVWALDSPAVLLRSHSGSRDSGVRVSTASDDSTIRGKVASGLISAGLGLMFSTPGCSEVDSESLHEYQQIGSYDSEEEQEILGSCLRSDPPVHPVNSPRRESGISLASGIYEEIAETPLSEGNDQNHYENPSNLNWNNVVNDPSPPPLPPRKHQNFAQTLSSMSEETLDDAAKTCYKTPLPAPLALRLERAYSASCTSLSSSTRGWDFGIGRKRLLSSEPEPDYVPMSPSSKAKPAEEPLYMPMASLNIT